MKELGILNEFKNIKFFGINSTLKELRRIDDRKLVCKLFFSIKLLAPFRKIKNVVRGI
ncbi:hypothetical protein HS141_05680 [Cetobacterium somerae]|uniref:hypothetical protein n=1 Tax=Cetobacterium somerae TaxID=188913 RepID=UPI00211E8400|nr:hypothetical protein [Cetobacterium somerae]MCQ9626460.1 hypothetical protein [Cetobacterium somerae]